MTPTESPHILTTPYHFSIAWEGPLNVKEFSDRVLLPDKLSTASLKRKAEFLAGRFCAAKAIQLCRPDWSGEIEMNSDGSPSWPEGLIGSITHTDGFASAAVARNDTFISVGIDSEKLADLQTLKAAGEISLTQDEWTLGSHRPIPKNEFILLVFSAKESIYKCLYPLIKRSLDFSAISLHHFDFENHTFNFHLVEPIETRLFDCSDALGQFEFSRGYIHTGIELRHPLRRTKTGKCS
jgi:enterobactin synthetase component D